MYRTSFPLTFRLPANDYEIESETERDIDREQASEKARERVCVRESVCVREREVPQVLSADLLLALEHCQHSPRHETQHVETVKARFWP